MRPSSVSLFTAACVFLSTDLVASYVLPVPGDCTKFQMCDYSGCFVFSCGAGTEFNEKTLVCDYPLQDRASCGARQNLGLGLTGQLHPGVPASSGGPAGQIGPIGGGVPAVPCPGGPACGGGGGRGFTGYPAGGQGPAAGYPGGQGPAAGYPGGQGTAGGYPGGQGPVGGYPGGGAAGNAIPESRC